MDKISHQRLLELLHYDEESGEFTWLVNRGAAKQGNKAGTVHRLGYVRIEIAGRFYLAHRLAWFFIYGEWPEMELDHANGIKIDNRLSNLRLASRSQNNANKSVATFCKSGLKGVRKMKWGSWVAQMSFNGKSIHLGSFNCPAAASFAYQIAADKNHGEFAKGA